ncbi:MAG: hypothetical protein ABSA47_18650 [Verrucomicrobiota bacterium]|jgi:hypothetical protein
MDPLAAMKRVPLPPDEGAESAGGPMPGRGRRAAWSVSRSPTLYLVILRKALGHPRRCDRGLGQK